MILQHNVSLRPYNTFGIDATAELYAAVHNIQELEEIAVMPQQKHVLGGGSNILLTQPIKGLVVHNKLKGIAIEQETDEHVWLRVQSGEVWHELVMYAIGNGWGGIENLALIPGTAGASPMQNIGAYGIEAKETIESVTFWHWQEKDFITYKNGECDFGYRDSIFKHQLKDKTFITSIVYKLDKKPKYNIGYGTLEHELEKMGMQELSVKAIAEAVINIRTSKLPDPKQIGNAGSFFKNPTVLKEDFAKLQAAYPAIPSYPVNEITVKIPAAWLIEQCGWKGYKNGEIGVHKNQALVLVNYGNAHGSDIWDLSSEVVASVNEKFGIALEREVQVW
jgi:UDP-N-acetylmuramate dehydrogenase